MCSILFVSLVYIHSFQDMLTDGLVVKLNMIVLYGLFTFIVSTVLYPFYIRALRKYKAGKTIREVDVTGTQATIFHSLHGYKSGTPTMG